MIVSIQPTAISGEVRAPASKSSMQRACAAAVLSEGKTSIFNPGKSNDDLAAIDTITKLGAVITRSDEGALEVESKGVYPLSGEIDCGESGLGIRMFTPIAALSKQKIMVTGKGSLITRPMDFFDDIFPKLNIGIQSSGGKLPLVIQGPLKPVDIEVDGSLSSQFLTGLLMAYGAAGAKNVSIRVKGLKSRPYIDLTLEVMRIFGVAVENDRYEKFSFGKSNSGFHATSYTVEGDWSGGAFLLVAGAIAGPIKVKGLDLHSTQADRAVMMALEQSGAKIEYRDSLIEIGPDELKAFEFDATDCPDLFPPLVALAVFCEGVTRVKGVSRLTHKESDRGAALQEEFGKMGAKIKIEGDWMILTGGSALIGAKVSSHHDHRIAMACAVAGLRAAGEMEIADADAINKSYPDFFEDLIQLGAMVDIKHTTQQA
ncbi:MAG: 3-phosphoshikimate 1-carboxyvinyltransferase [Chitinophagaceae bacterium]